MEAGERVNALGTKKLFPLIVSMSIPAICGNITTALYNVVDRLFVGQFVGRIALGAIGLMFPLNNVTSAITVLLTIGGGALISLSLGRKEKDNCFNGSHTCIYCYIIFLHIRQSAYIFMWSEGKFSTS